VLGFVASIQPTLVGDRTVFVNSRRYLVPRILVILDLNVPVGANPLWLPRVAL
jgi:hypothetical protein